MIKDIFEDHNKYLLDESVNRRMTKRLVSGEWQPVEWRDVQAGDIMFIEEDESFPADILILGSSDGAGVAFIETSNFDGETNLKIKHASPSILKPGTSLQQAENIDIVVRIQNPTKNLGNAGWSGSIEHEGKDVPLSPVQFVPRACILKNTKWMVGLAVYTGVETKLALNNIKTMDKKSSLARITDSVIIALVIIELLFSLVGLGLNIFFTKNSYPNIWLLNQTVEGKTKTLGWVDSMLTFISYFIISQNLIPISLYIMLDIIRYLQASFIKSDLSMYDSEKNYFPSVQASGLNEDLGRVSYLFSDKTGTLTQNKMFFKRCFVKNKKWGGRKGSSQQDFYVLPEGIDSHEDRFGEEDFIKNDFAVGSELDNFMSVLSLSHSVLAYVTKENDIDYQASSPDERCLVLQAAKYGYYFYGRKSEEIRIGDISFDGQIVLINIRGTQYCFEVLELIEFTSDRRKMSVIVRDPRDKKIKVLCKGADSAIEESLRSDQMDAFNKSKEAQLEFANQGLRTLAFGIRELTEEEFVSWYKDKEKDKEVGKEDNYTGIDVESDLVFSGITAIEDSLQSGVPECVEKILQAGIQMWMLTGDKVETAVNIARSARIIPADFFETGELVFLKYTEKSKRRDSTFLVEAAEKLQELGNRKTGKFVIVLTGDYLDQLFPENERLLTAEEITPLKTFQSLFFAASEKAISLICCRASPKQKQKLVMAVQEKHRKVVLSIGDGANDVPMIKQANIGVGLMGLEGTEAANAADYSLGKFKYLETLLFIHGGWSYTRIAKATSFMMFKNITFALISMLYVFYNGFSATFFGHASYSAYYNLWFTTLPAFGLGLFEQPFSKKVARANPSLYKFSQKNYFFTPGKIFLSFVRAIYFAALNMFISVVSFMKPNMNKGLTPSLAMASSASMGALVTVINTYSLFEIKNWNTLILMFNLGSIFIWYVYFVVFSIDYMSAESYYWVAPLLLTNPNYWIYLYVVFCLSYIPLILNRILRRVFFENKLDIAQEEEAGMVRKKNPDLLKNMINTWNIKSLPIKRGSDQLFDGFGYVPFAQDASLEKIQTVSQKELMKMILKKSPQE